MDDKINMGNNEIDSVSTVRNTADIVDGSTPSGLSVAAFLNRIRPAIHKIPAHSNGFFYCLGGIIVIGFLIMIGTGILLGQFYNPTPESSYASLKNIQSHEWTSYLRALHYWVAQGIIVALLLHLARVFITGAYKYPRQITWWVGVTLFAMMLMGSYFTGTILKWDEEGFDALSHYREALSALGPIGHFMTESLPGSAPMNFRVYLSHIVLFPLLLLFLIGLHIFLIRILNLSPTPKDQWADQPDIPLSEMHGTFDEHGKYVVVFALLYFGWLAVLAFFVRAPLGGPPVPEHGALKPPWPFLWMYGFENRWGIVATVYASSIFFGLLALVPLLDRKQDRRFRARVGVLTLGTIVALSLIGLTLHGYITPAQTHTHHHAHEEDNTSSPAASVDSHHKEEADHHGSDPHSHEADTEHGHGETSHQEIPTEGEPTHQEGEGH